MRKILTTVFCLFILAAFTTISAQKSAENVEQAVKEAMKEAKKARKEGEKAFKEGKKAYKEGKKTAKKALKESAKVVEIEDKLSAADLMMGATGSPKTFVAKDPVLNTPGDSLAYIFGIAQSDGLKNYMSQQLGVDSAYVEDFFAGMMDRTSLDPSDKKKHAYFQGMSIGGQVGQLSENMSKDYYAADPDKKINPAIVAAGIIAGMQGKGTMTAEEAMKDFQTKMQARQKENSDRLYGKNKEDGARFLAENKGKDGVVSLPSGLQYKVLTQGTGAIPKATNKVKVHYEGHLIDGTEFDSSYKRGEPTSFGVNQVIKGWTEALCLMPVGSKWELYIPYNLAYGERAAGKIPPFSTLIFTVELLSIEK